jgi:3-oxoadipate enol-lactonase
VTLTYDELGGGPAVMLLHSTASDRRMWDPQMPALAAAGSRVVRCDLRGFGATPVPDRPWNHADDATALLDELGIDRFALVGSSGGGRVAVEIAARHPARVTALALLCTAMAGHEPSAELSAFGAREDELLEAGDIDGATDLNVDTWLGPAAGPAARDHLRLMQRHIFDVQGIGPEEFAPITYEIDPAAITAPTLLVAGAHDFADFRQIAVLLAGRIAGARHVELDWAGHLPSMERPDAINPLLVDFLSESRRS